MLAHTRADELARLGFATERIATVPNNCLGTETRGPAFDLAADAEWRP
jgi:hypothetical protein